MSTFYDLKADLPGGAAYDFSTLKGKVVLIVNTASAWYVTPFALSKHESDPNFSAVLLPSTRVHNNLTTLYFTLN
jgi:glutathione peroxidase-family protein